MSGKGHSFATANEARRFSTELVELMARYEDRSGENLVEVEAADRNSELAARKLFTKSGACLYLCLNDEDRMQHHDELVQELKSYAEYEAVTDVTGAFWLTVRLSFLRLQSTVLVTSSDSQPVTYHRRFPLTNTGNAGRLVGLSRTLGLSRGETGLLAGLLSASPLLRLAEV